MEHRSEVNKSYSQFQQVTQCKHCSASESVFNIAGESIPIRLFLAGYDLTPTMRDINKKFSVRYYLNLVLIDEEERRYFKQQVRLEAKHQTAFLHFSESSTSLV